jgi:hypothetical protein
MWICENAETGIVDKSIEVMGLRQEEAGKIR